MSTKLETRKGTRQYTSAYSNWQKTRMKKRGIWTQFKQILHTRRNLTVANLSTRLSQNFTKLRKTDRRTLANNKRRKNDLNLFRKRSRRDLGSLRAWRTKSFIRCIIAYLKAWSSKKKTSSLKIPRKDSTLTRLAASSQRWDSSHQFRLPRVLTNWSVSFLNFWADRPRIQIKKVRKLILKKRRKRKSESRLMTWHIPWWWLTAARCPSGK